MSKTVRSIPEFSAKGCYEVVLDLETVIMSELPDEYDRDRWAWVTIKLYLTRLIENPTIFGEKSSFGFVQAMSNIITWPHDLIVEARWAANLALQPVIENLISGYGFCDALESAFLHEFPGCVPRFGFNTDLKVVEIKVPCGPGILGKVKRRALRYPSPKVIQQRLSDFFPDDSILTFKSAVFPDSVRFVAYRTPADPETLKEYETDPDVKARIDLGRDLVDMARKASSSAGVGHRL